MSLSLYNKKRHFNETSEPKGALKSSKKGGLRFVVQKHDASHVHYDFRLEMEGVLKSWAVPKGPSLRPADKRLAMMVEDHPYDYRNFEGVIPEGNYGGGTVIVWDEGTYEPIGGEGLSKKEQEKLLLQQLQKGRLDFSLHGNKLNGAFALFQMKSRGDRSWILVKKKDDFAEERDITQEANSVKTGKTLVEVAAANGTVVNHPETVNTTRSTKAKQAKAVPAAAAKKAPAKTKTNATAAGKKKAADIKALLGNYASLAKKNPMPQEIKPMLATLVDEPFNDENWLFEIKWDGYRCVTYADGKQVELISRNLTPFTEKYFPVTEALQQLGIHAVLDGEIVAVNDKGLADFQMLQNWQNTPVHLRYFIFDILWLEGYDITALPLVERKRILQAVLPANDEVIRYSDHTVGNGKEFFQVAVKQGLEGIMAKKANSIYQVNARTQDWVKVKVNLRQEVVIAGYTEPRKTRKFFGSILLGVYEGEELVYVGHSGSGFNAKSLKQLYDQMQPLKTIECPFVNRPHTNMPATWVKPKLVCEIKFTEWTKENIARHPIFMGLRTDKKPKDVKLEKATHMASISKKGTARKKAPATKNAKVETSAPKPKSAKAASPATVSNEEGEGDKTVVLNKHEIKLTNLNKEYWKQEHFTKGDLVRYYRDMAPYILPYLKNRPESLHRFPNGIDAPGFYQKDVAGKVPEWMETYQDFSESTQETVSYLVCNNEAALAYMANLGCIEIHPWHARVQSPDAPDWCLIDLDPDKPNSFDQVIDTAKVVKQVLDAIGADSYCKTSGSTGIHIFLPLGAKYSYDQSRQLAELIVNLVHQELPDLTSLERSPGKRKGKIYLDFLQNSQTQTAAAPYSLRPRRGVPVSTPLDWSELKKGILPTDFTAYSIFDRLKAEGDLFRPVLGKGINLEKVLKKVQSLSKG